jgi:hypothetical protein
MKIALIDAKRSRVDIKTRTAVNYRNMLTIQNIFNAVGLYDIFDLKRNINNNFDVFICGFGSPSNDFELTVELFNKNPTAKIFWLVGEYEQSNYWAILKAKRKFHIIKNFEGKGKVAKKDSVLSWNTLNLNLLIAKNANSLTEKKYDCVYYSRWRPNRSKYLKEYLREDIYFSSDSKNFKQHKHIGCNPKWIKKLSWENKKETLSLFKYSLYLEDEKTHKVFNNLANRWYEAGFCNNVVFFDVNCRNTINKSELSYYKEQVEDYIVKDYEDLQDKIKECNKDFNKHLAIQKSWRMNEATARTNMLKELKNIIYNGTK